MHTPVLLEEVIKFFEPFAGGKFIDATVGYGGHTFAILERIPGSRVLGIDADASALVFCEAERKRRGMSEDRLVLVQGNFRDCDTIAAAHAFDHPQGILFDFGVSSGALDDAERGFSFIREGPLDMRFDTRAREMAQDIVNQWPAHALERMIKDYGEERHARRIAQAIVAARIKKRFTTTTALAECIARLPGMRRGKIHPATRTFQALRITINDELAAIRAALPKAIDLCAPHGRVITISFHSLEDRIAKEIFRHEDRVEKRITILTKHVLRPSREEQMQNPRSRSAKLRVIEKR